MILFKYNPLKTKYKSVVGAVEVGSELSITLLASKELHLDRVSLVVKPDQTNVQLRYAMDLKGTEGRYNAFSATVPFDEVGLFWYNFEVSAFDVTARVGIDVNRNTRLYYSDAPYYQLSVFKHEYDSPDWLQDGVMYQIFPDRFFRDDAPQTITEGRILRLVGRSNLGYKPVTVEYVQRLFRGHLKALFQTRPILKSLMYVNLPILFFRASATTDYDTEDSNKSIRFSSTTIFISVRQGEGERHTKLLRSIQSFGSRSKYFKRAGKYNTVGAYQSRLSPYFDWYKFSPSTKEILSWWA